MAGTTSTTIDDATIEERKGEEVTRNYLTVDELMMNPSDLNKHLIWSTTMDDSSVQKDDGNERDRLLSTTTTMALKDTETVRNALKGADGDAEADADTAGPSTSSGSLMEVTKYNSNDEIMRFNTALVFISILIQIDCIFI